MLRFLKKHRKSHKKPAPPGSPAHQTADIGVECGMDPEGEHRQERSRLIRPMELIRLWHQLPTTEGIFGSKIRTRGLEISGFPRRMLQPRLQGTEVTTRVSVVGCSHRGRRLTFIPQPASATRTRTPKQELRGTAERATRCQRSRSPLCWNGPKHS